MVGFIKVCIKDMYNDFTGYLECTTLSECAGVISRYGA